MINKNELKNKLKWILLTVFAWMIALPLSSRSIELYGWNTTIMIGIIGILFVAIILD